MYIKPLTEEERIAISNIFSGSSNNHCNKNTFLFKELTRENEQVSSKILATVDGRVQSSENLYF